MFFFFGTQNMAQVRRIVLMEVATNSGCGSCAVSNEIMNNFYRENFGGVISLRYHAAWPDNSDPMYRDNTADNNARVHYYGVTYTPQYFMDGFSKGSADNEERMISEMQNDMFKTSPLWIDIDSEINADTVKYNIKITAFADVNIPQLKLRTSVIERMKHFDEPPGSNGETDFPDVMRKLLPDSNGISIPPMYNGDTLAFSFATPVESSWNWKDLAVVAWAQNDENKEVIQSNINLPTVIITSNQSDFILVEPNSSYATSYVIRNENDKTINISLTSETNSIPLSWSNQFSPISIEIAPHDSLMFIDNFTTDTLRSILSVQFRVTNNDDYLHYDFRHPFLAASSEQDVLIINNNHDANPQTEIFPYLDSLKLNYASISSFDTQHWSNRLSQLSIKSTMLFAGNTYPPYYKPDIDFLIDLQNKGVPVLVSGQKISYSRTDFSTATNFYDNYLDAQFISLGSADTIYSVSNNPISSIDELHLSGFYTSEPEIITSRAGSSFPIFRLNRTDSQIVALANQTTDFKNVYLAFGIEQIADSRKRKELFHDIFNWFGILQPNGIEEESEIPTDFVLYQNYPNPFSKGFSGNPTTTIAFTVAKKGFYELSVFNILGEKITTLLQKSLEKGKYNAKFNGENLASGVYIYRLQGENVNISKKMILMK